MKVLDLFFCINRSVNLHTLYPNHENGSHHGNRIIFKYLEQIV